jgi:polyhydroxyalkanoate synthesis regulator phasin
MSDVKKPIEDREKTPQRGRLLGTVRKLLLAGVGAMALAQDEAQEFIDRLVERGEIAEGDGKQLMRDLKSRRKRQTKRVEDELDQRVAEVLDRMNIPTKSEIQTLSDKLAELGEKVDKLK